MLIFLPVFYCMTVNILLGYTTRKIYKFIEQGFLKKVIPPPWGQFQYIRAITSKGAEGGRDDLKNFGSFNILKLTLDILELHIKNKKKVLGFFKW